MPKNFSRRALLAAAAPIAAAPIAAKLALGERMAAAASPDHDHAAHAAASPDHMVAGHAAMIGEGAPAVGGPHDLDALLYPPPPLAAARAGYASTC